MVGRFFNRSALGLILATVTGGLYPATAGVGLWADGVKASARLIAEGLDANGELSAGIEIILPPGWKTYWRSPGDAGIAPVIDFTASGNIGPAKIRFPAPHRFDDGYSVTNIYEDSVFLSFSVPVVDPAAPVHLEVKMHLGVCELVCVPESLTMALDIEPEKHDDYAAGLLAAAREQLPKSPEPGVFAVLGVDRDGGTDKRPEFTFNAVVPNGEQAVFFVEGPPGWYPNVPKFAGNMGAESVYRVKFSRLGATAPIAGALFTVLIVSGDRAIEQVVSLD
ncbi:MAG: protein-disulfide reductase DsbD domain-containing protein [Alphaproteobacteria bacterium]